MNRTSSDLIVRSMPTDIRAASGFNVSVAWPLVATGLAYYLGGLIGLSLRVPDATPSIVWPPNAILTAALILTPRRLWFPILLSVLPVHLAAQLPTGWPIPLIFSFFATNCSEALIAAVALRFLSDQPTSLDTFRRFGAFICAVVLAAPVLSSFLDAAVAAGLRGDPYWLVWRIRVPSNILAQLALTPAIVGCITRGIPWFQRAPMPRRLEAAVLAACLVASGWLAFGSPFGSSGLPKLAADAPLIVQLPFLLWAAFRFGPSGTSMSLLVMTLVAAWALVGGALPPASFPADTVFLTQLFLISAGITLLGLSALIEERRQSMHAVSERLRFEELLFEFSRAFVRVPSAPMNAISHEWLGRIGTFLGLECVRLFQLEPYERAVAVVSEWRKPGFQPAPPIVLHRDAPWILGRIQARRPVVLSNGDALPVDAARDRATLETQGYKALLVMPMLAGDELVGALEFGAGSEREWGEELVGSLRLMSDVLANALARRRVDDELRISEDVKSSILDSLSNGVAVIDADGRLLDANANWIRLSEDSHVLPHLRVNVGDDLLGVSSRDSAQGIRAVLEGSRPRFTAEYTSVTSEGARWWVFTAVRLNRSEGGAVLTLAEITEQRRAEMAALRSRQELAHVGRISTMGELTGSLAHQLNQPLTGVMCNAQAACRLLKRSPLDYTELRAALTDIVDDARRASEVVGRLRELLRRGEFAMAPVDLVEVIREVSHLVISDAIIRNVAVSLDLEPYSVIVRGDRVQLQQLVLNLMVNALEAIGEGERQRVVVVRCYRQGDQEVRVAVHDSGPGLTEGTEDMVFDPFYTTKPNGMGMGLSIARSIVDTHGGHICGRTDPNGGSTFEFALPIDASAAVAG